MVGGVMDLGICLDVLPEGLPRGEVFPDGAFKVALRGLCWPNGSTLRVNVLDGDASVRERIEHFAQQWCAWANVTMEFGVDQYSEIRVELGPLPPWSYLGRDALRSPLDGPTMNLGPLDDDVSDDVLAAVVLHEFGHALGLAHEHPQPRGGVPWDVGAVEKAWGACGWSPERVRRDVLDRYGCETTHRGAVDPHSVMRLPLPAALTGGRWPVRWRHVLSDGDKAFAGALYPRPVDLVTPLFIDGPSCNAEISRPEEIDVYRFEVQEAGRYCVETGGIIDTVLALYDGDDVLAEDDDGGFFHNARVEVDLQPGEYTVRVWHFMPQGTGRYGIWVARQAVSDE